ncbi:hypothetical protein MASR2M15_05850 [Anaerolineales bacterium]
MPSWYLKVAIQGTLSLLPQSHRWNYIFQRLVSKKLQLSAAYFEEKLALCVEHINYYDNYNSNSPSRIVELGTGWLPIVPIGMALMQEAEIISIDLTPLLRDQLVQETLAFFIRYADEGLLVQKLPRVKQSQVDKLRDALQMVEEKGAEQALALLGIRYYVGDARTFRLDDLDFFISNNTLEHIPGPVIKEIFQNFHSILGAKGLMSHLIDLSDHYSQFDKNLTPYNFLKFSSNRWKPYNNKLQYQNRLRLSDYKTIHQEAGYEILSEDNKSASINLLDEITLSPEFSTYTREDLAVTSSWIVSRPQRPTA